MTAKEMNLILAFVRAAPAEYGNRWINYNDFESFLEYLVDNKES